MRKIWTPSIILPRILQSDARLTAVRDALEKLLAAVSEDARETLHLPRLDQLSEPMLDVLLNQYHADFFESDMSKETKREIIRDALQWHRRKGTPAAVEEVARKVYRDARVSEWYEYGGQPYFFRIMQDITADDEDTDQRTLDRLRAAVFEAKNLRSWLEFYGFLLTLEDELDPTDAHTMTIREVYHDEYDYRRNNNRYDGSIDYGASLWRYNGRYSYNGEITYRGYVARGNYGRFQASDFEVLRVVRSSDALTDALNVVDILHTSSSTQVLIDHADGIRDATMPPELKHISRDEETSYDSMTAKRLTHSASDEVASSDPVRTNRIRYKDVSETLKTGDRLSITGLVHYAIDQPETADMGITARLRHIVREDTDTPRENTPVTMRQPITYNGRWKYNGTIRYTGTLVVTEDWIKERDATAWENMMLWLKAHFEEACPTCGSVAREYVWGSARIGSEVFFISDLQLLTVDIICSNCGETVAQYLVEDGSWEAIV